MKSWKSSNTAIVKVDKKGVITAQKKTGTAYITVTLASKKTAKLKSRCTERNSKNCGHNRTAVQNNHQ